MGFNSSVIFWYTSLKETNDERTDTLQNRKTSAGIAV